MKKYISLLLALILSLALCVPMLADEPAAPTTEVTVTSSVTGYAPTYNAYKLLDLTTALVCKTEEHTHDDTCDADCAKTLHTHSDKDCYIYSYTVAAGYADILKTALGITDADLATATLNEVVYNKLSAMADKGSAIRSFADTVMNAINAKNTTTPGTFTPVELQNATAANLAQGYWLIVDVTADPGDGVTRSLAMLDTAGAEKVAITAKDDVHTLTKVVDDNDVYINQTVNYTLTFPLPSNLAEFSAYTFIVGDTLSDGLDFVTDSYKLSIGGVDKTTETATNYAPTFTGRTMTVDLGAYILGNTTTTNGVKSNSFANREVKITYSAKVNDDAVIAAAGNDNEATLTYSHSPYATGDAQLKDSATVSTYAIAIKKVNTAGEALADATFKFPFYVKNTPANDGSYIYFCSENEYASLTEAEKATVTNELTTPASGEITVKGVESGSYTIEETKAPNGYNKLAAPVTVAATQTTAVKTEKTWYIDANGAVTDTETNVSVTYTNNYFAADAVMVINKNGLELPSTGGIGTTIFYAVGGALMAGAVILLITKKKMSNEE